MTLLDQLVSCGAEATPNATAIIEPRDAITYAELERKVNRVAKALLGAGITRGDRVILALENSIAFVAAYFGIMRAGAVAVPLAPGMKNDRLHTAVADCAPVRIHRRQRNPWRRRALGCVAAQATGVGPRSQRHRSPVSGSDELDRGPGEPGMRRQFSSSERD